MYLLGRKYRYIVIISYYSKNYNDFFMNVLFAFYLQEAYEKKPKMIKKFLIFTIGAKDFAVGMDFYILICYNKLIRENF